MATKLSKPSALYTEELVISAINHRIGGEIADKQAAGEEFDIPDFLQQRTRDIFKECGENSNRIREIVEQFETDHPEHSHKNPGKTLAGQAVGTAAAAVLSGAKAVGIHNLLGKVMSGHGGKDAAKTGDAEKQPDVPSAQAAVDHVAAAETPVRAH